MSETINQSKRSDQAYLVSAFMLVFIDECLTGVGLVAFNTCQNTPVRASLGQVGGKIRTLKVDCIGRFAVGPTCRSGVPIVGPTDRSNVGLTPVRLRHVSSDI